MSVFEFFFKYSRYFSNVLEIRSALEKLTFDRGVSLFRLRDAVSETCVS